MHQSLLACLLLLPSKRFAGLWWHRLDRVDRVIVWSRRWKQTLLACPQAPPSHQCTNNFSFKECCHEPTGRRSFSWYAGVHPFRLKEHLEIGVLARNSAPVPPLTLARCPPPPCPCAHSHRQSRWRPDDRYHQDAPPDSQEPRPGAVLFRESRVG